MPRVREPRKKLFCCNEHKKLFAASGPPQEVVVHSVPNYTYNAKGQLAVNYLRAETPWRIFHSERNLCLWCRKSVKHSGVTLAIPPRDEVPQTGTNIVPLKRRVKSG